MKSLSLSQCRLLFHSHFYSSCWWWWCWCLDNNNKNNNNSDGVWDKFVIPLDKTRSSLVYVCVVLSHRKRSDFEERRETSCKFIYIFIFFVFFFHWIFLCSLSMLLHTTTNTQKLLGKYIRANTNLPFCRVLQFYFYNEGHAWGLQ